MSMKSIVLGSCLASAGLMLCLGCSKGPGRIPKPTVDSDDAAQQAFELYDVDGDGFIAGAELDKAVGIKAGLKKADSDSDGKVSPTELIARVEAWNQSPYSILPISCGVVLNGQTLEGAAVIFDPEPFLKDVLKEGQGVSNTVGSAAVSIPKEKRLVEDSPPGLQMGYYVVRISKQENGKELIPPQYNSASILGQEVAYDDPAFQSQIIFRLQTK
jgi:hypothetical protein